jgi:hypothetical protein
MSKNKSYSDKLRDPRWQKKRLEILQRDDFACQFCFETKNTLAVHHLYYWPHYEPWEYENDCYLTLCEDCHKHETEWLPKACSRLAQGFKRAGFTACGIQLIADSLDNLKLQHVNDVVATAYARALSDPKVQSRLIDEYFEQLAEKHAET